MSIAICITTHNRRADLARTLDALARLSPQPDEIIVTADGCDDGTTEFLRTAHPRVHVIEHQIPLGSIPSRNEMAVACRSEFFLSLDDDSHPIEIDFLTCASAIFAKHPRLAVLSFPQRTDEFPATLDAADFGPSQLVGSYANSGAMIRRATFVELGAYPQFFFHAYEEPDFALRCVCAGWQVRHETTLTIRHHFTPAQRNEIRTHHRHARNEFWSILLRCPAPQLFAVALFRAARQFRYAFSRGMPWVLNEPKWWCAALAGIPRCLSAREPLPWTNYLAWMRLVREPVPCWGESE